MSQSTRGSSRTFTVTVVLAATLACGRGLGAQGPTTAAISGIVGDDDRHAISNALIEVTNSATGVVARGRSREDGHFTVFGLEAGGPYVVAVRHIGYRAQTRDRLRLSIGENLVIAVRLERQAVTLQGVRTETDANDVLSRVSGVGAHFSDSALHRLPTADRDLYGFVRLVPQVSTLYGLSGAGTSPRMNSFMLDGTSEQGLFGGVPGGGVYGGKTISLEAVKEYEVQLSPYDVRHGNFAGAVINAVTKSGTNDLHGSAFYYGRYEALARNVPFIRDAHYERAQAGFTLGGPIVHNHAHFFVASELQSLVFPTIGPYVGQPATNDTPLPIPEATIGRFQNLLAARGLDGGSAGPIVASNPVANLFARIDVALPRLNSRLVARENYGHADSTAFARPSPPPTSNCLTLVCFPLSSSARRQTVDKSGAVVQLYTSFPSGAYNELFTGRLTVVTTIRPTVNAPLVLVRIKDPGLDATLQSGTYEQAQGDRTENRSFEVTDNITVPIAHHQITAGITGQFFRVRRLDVRGAYGVWQFDNLDSLERGTATRYRVTQDIAGADVTLSGVQYGIYAGDRWDVAPRVALTYGLRADIPTLEHHPPFNDQVYAVFGRRTDVVPSGDIQWSPRAGFTVDVTGEGRTRLRGGVGAFAGRPPLGWLINAFANYGQARTLNCGTPGTAPPPTFAVDYRNPPLACSDGQGLTSASAGSVNLLDQHLKLSQNLRASLGIDQRLPWDVVATVEGLYTKALRELFFVNRNLAEPNGVDRHGRVMYGVPLSKGQVTVNLAAAQFKPDVIELTNESKDYSSSISGQLAKQFFTGFEGRVSFAYSRTRDVQSQRFVRNPAVDNWRFGRVLAGRQDLATVGVSDFDQPYRIVASGTYAFPWRLWTTDLSFYYLGNSGLPFTYVAGGNQNTGDLNADGTNVNDPIYIPRSAFDTAEIQFSGDAASVARQAEALERFIDGAFCLRRQRGRIMARNSCRSPWINTTNISLRQSVPPVHGHQLAVELEIFNLLNFLNGHWGRIALPSAITTPIAEVNLFSQVDQTSGPLSRSQPIFAFDPETRRFDSRNVDSYYQMQLSARYSF